MGDLPTRNQKQYVDLAVKLGTDNDYRNEISQRINRQKQLVVERDDDLPHWEWFFEEILQNESMHDGEK